MPTGSRPAPDEFELALASLIRGVASSRKVTQVEVVRRSGIPRPTIVRLWNGQRGMSVNQLMRIAAALEVDAAELLATASRVVGGGSEVDAVGQFAP